MPKTADWPLIRLLWITHNKQYPSITTDNYEHGLTVSTGQRHTREKIMGKCAKTCMMKPERVFQNTVETIDSVK